MTTRETIRDLERVRRCDLCCKSCFSPLSPPRPCGGDGIHPFPSSVERAIAVILRFSPLSAVPRSRVPRSSPLAIRPPVADTSAVPHAPSSSLTDQPHSLASAPSRSPVWPHIVCSCRSAINTRLHVVGWRTLSTANSLKRK